MFRWWVAAATLAVSVTASPPATMLADALTVVDVAVRVCAWTLAEPPQRPAESTAVTTYE